MNILFDIGITLFVIIFGLVLLGMILMMFEDTETFQVIDEKIARLLKGSEARDE